MVGVFSDALFFGARKRQMSDYPLYSMIGNYKFVTVEVLRQCMRDIEARVQEDKHVTSWILDGLIVQMISDVKWQEFDVVYRYAQSRYDDFSQKELDRLHNLCGALEVYSFLIATWERVCEPLRGQEVYTRLFTELRKDYNTLILIVNAGLFKSLDRFNIALLHTLSQIIPACIGSKEYKKRIIDCFQSLEAQGALAFNDRRFFQKYMQKYTDNVCALIEGLTHGG